MIFIRKKSVRSYRGQFLDILRLLLSGKLNRGECVGQFEKTFARYIGAEHAVAVSSGRFALYCILSGLGIGEGDEVILSAYNFKAVPQVILKCGARPVFADIDPSTLNIDPASIENRITPRTRAVIVTHIFGCPADIEKVKAVAVKHNLKLIEDCAHACGMEHAGRKLGSFGDCAFFSFWTTKNMNTFGGGMITTNDAGLARFLRGETEKLDDVPPWTLLSECLKHYFYLFILNPFVYPFLTWPLLLCANAVGYDHLKRLRNRKVEPADRWRKYSNLQSCVGLKMLGALDRFISGKLDRLAYVDGRLPRGMPLQTGPVDGRPASLYLAFLSKDPLGTKKKLFLRGIDCDDAFMQDCAALFKSPEPCPVTEKVCGQILLIQLEGRTTDRELNELAAILSKEVLPPENAR